MLQPSHLNTPDQAQKIARAIIDAGQSLDATQIKGTGPAADAARENFKNAAVAELNKDRVSARDNRQMADIDKRIGQISGNVSAAHGFDPTANQFIPEGAPGFVRDGDQSLVINVKNDVTYINKLPNDSTKGSNELTDKIVAGVSAEDIQKSADRALAGSQADRDAAYQALEKMQQMIEKAPAAPDGDPFSSGGEEASRYKQALEAKNQRAKTSLKALEAAGLTPKPTAP
jgi:hypothetical protein